MIDRRVTRLSLFKRPEFARKNRLSQLQGARRSVARRCTRFPDSPLSRTRYSHRQAENTHASRARQLEVLQVINEIDPRYTFAQIEQRDRRAARCYRTKANLLALTDTVTRITPFGQSSLSTRLVGRNRVARARQCGRFVAYNWPPVWIINCRECPGRCSAISRDDNGIWNMAVGLKKDRTLRRRHCFLDNGLPFRCD